MTINSQYNYFSERLEDLSAAFDMPARLLTVKFKKDAGFFLPCVLIAFIPSTGEPDFITVQGKPIPDFAMADKDYRERLEQKLWELAPAITQKEIHAIYEFLNEQGAG